MDKELLTSKVLADRFREDSTKALSALAKRLYAKHHDGHLPWEGDIDPDADADFHLDLESPVSFLATVDDVCGVVWEEDFITIIHFGVDNEWFETADNSEMEYSDLSLDDLHNLHVALEKALAKEEDKTPLFAAGETVTVHFPESKEYSCPAEDRKGTILTVIPQGDRIGGHETNNSGEYMYEVQFEDTVATCKQSIITKD